MKRLYSFFLILLSSLAASGQDKLAFSLEDCRSLALENNTAIRKARMDNQAAELRRKEMYTWFFPQVGITSMGFWSEKARVDFLLDDIFVNSDAAQDVSIILGELAPELGLSESFHFFKYGFNAGISLFQPIYTGGRIRQSYQIAHLLEDASDIKREIVEKFVLNQIDKNYFMLASLQEKQNLVDALDNYLSEMEEIATLAMDNGVIVKSEFMQLKSKRMELNAGRHKLKTGIRLAKMNLLNSMGVEYSILNLDNYEFPAADFNDVPAPEDVYIEENQAVANMNESRLLDIYVKTRQHQKKITLGGSLPSVGLGARYGVSRFDIRDEFKWNGGVYLALKIPISSWGRTSLALKRNQIEIDKAEATQRDLTEKLTLKLRKDYLELTSAWDAMQIAKEQKDYEEYLHEQARLSCENGYSTVADLLKSYSDLAKAEESYSTAVSDYITALHAYLECTGSEE